MLFTFFVAKMLLQAKKKRLDSTIQPIPLFDHSLFHNQLNKQGIYVQIRSEQWKFIWSLCCLGKLRGKINCKNKLMSPFLVPSQIIQTCFWEDIEKNKTSYLQSNTELSINKIIIKSVLTINSTIKIFINFFPCDTEIQWTNYYWQVIYICDVTLSCMEEKALLECWNEKANHFWKKKKKR